MAEARILAQGACNALRQVNPWQRHNGHSCPQRVCGCGVRVELRSVKEQVSQTLDQEFAFPGKHVAYDDAAEVHAFCFTLTLQVLRPINRVELYQPQPC